MNSRDRVERSVVTVAALGFFFDAYELLTLPLIVGPAMLLLCRCDPRPYGLRGDRGDNRWSHRLDHEPVPYGAILESTA